MKVYIIAATLALSACATVPQTVSIDVTKAAITADATYVGAYQAGAALVRNGRMSRDAFINAEAKAYNAILAIRAAKTVADLALAQGQLASAANTLGGQ